MPNIESAKKALRQSKKKRSQNQFWKNRIKREMKGLNKLLDDKGSDILSLKGEESALQKVLDKAAKNKAIHKNKARRLKSRFAKKIAVHEKTTKSTKTGDASKKKSKSSK
jgi:ribosomal protein S20